MQIHNNNRHGGEMDAECALTITREEALAGSRRMVCFHGPNGRELMIPIDIPAGIQTGTRLRIEGSAEQAGWACGELVAVITVVPNQRVEYRGADIHLKLQVDRATALREGTLQVPIGGERVVAVPIQRDQFYTRFVYPGLGLPRGYAPRRNGDLILHLELIELSPAYDDVATQLAAAQPPRRWWQTLFGA